MSTTHANLTPRELASRLEARASELVAEGEAGIRIAAALRASEDDDGSPASPALLERAKRWLTDPRSSR
ncbi:MAG: hypothetical protein KC619_31915 [Myxococcales bacterium]|nr:hypothetical protein [Myxococcales bacterium]